MLRIELYGLISGSELQKEIIAMLTDAKVSPGSLLVTSINSIVRNGRGEELGTIRVTSDTKDVSYEREICDLISVFMQKKGIKNICLPRE